MALSNEEVMERFMAFTVDGDSPKSFTLRGSQLVVSSVCAAKPGTLFAQTPMQDVPIPVAVLTEGSLTALMNLMFFEEDEKVVFSTDEGSVLHVSGRVALSRALQDEIEDDEEDVERMRAALGASSAGADGDEADEAEDDEDAEEEEEEEADDDDDEAEDDEEDADEEDEEDEGAAMSEEAQAVSRKRAREEAAASREREDEALLASARAAAKERVAALEPRLKETKKQRQRREKQEAAERAVAISKRVEEAEEAATEALEVAAEAAKAKRPRKAKKQDRKEVQLARGVNGVELFEGMGAFPKQGRKVTVRYVGRLADGSQFDANDRFSFRLGVGEVVPGFDIAVKSMRVGGKRRVVIPPEAGYGSRRSGPIPPNSHLVFDLELVRAH
ncbi:hypothetical protein FNF27_00050 [Cafeteria roenbergensis]|uniref:peptidylprolyl isomerase n=1 Tax=Cafeteria roenbergensis TaxID=33653 RepID=A0A5A8EJW2_CAFRO|nr:hypothetical protein FNF27_00050 [Cafeteria roenbergensis]